MRGAFVSEIIMGAFRRIKREIVDAVVNGDAIQMRHSEAGSNTAVVTFPEIGGGNIIPET